MKEKLASRFKAAVTEEKSWLWKELKKDDVFVFLWHKEHFRIYSIFELKLLFWLMYNRINDALNPE